MKVSTWQGLRKIANIENECKMAIVAGQLHHGALYKLRGVGGLGKGIPSRWVMYITPALYFESIYVFKPNLNVPGSAVQITAACGT